MIADPRGDTIDPGALAEIDRDSTGALQGLGVEPEPMGPATTRQMPVGDNNVGRGAGGGDVGPVDPVGRSRRQQPPFTGPLAN